jgi:DNA polymerase-3 subunit gamma/tau
MLGWAPAGESAPVSLAAAEQGERLARSRRVREAARAHPNIQEAARLLEGGVDQVEEL